MTKGFMHKLQIYLSDSLDPHLNLATEEWIFKSVDPSTQILFLWRNQHTVVIGRNQNPWSECNLSKMKSDQITLARRTTGGGAVFHDLGNTNFTFLSPKNAYKKENNIKIILDALKNFEISGEATGRNDLTVTFPDGPRKFSGSAYRETKDRAFHHGTLLLSADLTKLGNYLTPNPKKLQAKGKESVRARVVNLNEIHPVIDHDKIVTAVSASFESFYGSKAIVEKLNMDSLQKIPELKAHFDLLSSWNWLYGQTLQFSHQMDEYLSLGFFDFHFLVEDGLVKDLQIYTDSLYPQLVDDLLRLLKGKPYTASSVKSAFSHLYGTINTYKEINSGLAELENWLVRNVEI